MENAADVRGREDESSSSILLSWLCIEDVEQTRAMISKIASKPKCSDKLLSKPPFRFIHDLVMNIGKATDCYSLCKSSPLILYVLYLSEDELLSSNVKDKLSKLQFLEKLVNFLENKLDMTINVKPSKIVSGLEPERARYLLQLFTVVATKSDTIVDENATSTASKSIKERAKSLEGHLISKFAISEANRNAVPAWVSSVIVISTSVSFQEYPLHHTHTCSCS